MSDRAIVYVNEVPFDVDILYSNQGLYIGTARFAAAILGTSTLLNAFTCIPTSPATLTVNVTPGEIYILGQTDPSAYGSLGTNTTQIYKQGMTYTNVNLSTPAPSTVGNSINYLVQIAFSETDGNSANRPYYAAPSASTPQQRLDAAVVAIKAGTSAPTGTQTTPSPDSGYVSAFVVTVAHGQTTVISGNIGTPGSAPFLTETLVQKISQATADGRYSQITATQNGSATYAVDTGAANAYVATLVPAPSALVAGMVVQVKIANLNTSASTLNLNSLGVKNIKTSHVTSLQGGELPANMMARFSYDGTEWQLENPATAITRVVTQTFTSSGTYTPTPGMLYCEVEQWGAGGGGGGVPLTSGSQYSLAGGGGSGSYVKGKFTAAQIGASQVVTIGTAGAGGIGAADGTTGGATSLGVLTSAPGGIGGAQGSAISSTTGIQFFGGGVGGFGASGGDFNLSGFFGANAGIVNGNQNSGNGGGPGGGTGNVAGNGVSATSAAGGGGGAGNIASQSAKTGGAGGAGKMYIIEYCY